MIDPSRLPINKGNTNSFIDNATTSTFDIDDLRYSIINAILCINEIRFILDHWKKEILDHWKKERGLDENRYFELLKKQKWLSQCSPCRP